MAALSKNTHSVSIELLEEYTGGDREFALELTNQFWIDLEDRLPKLEAAVLEFNPGVVASIAHSLAGSASCIGAERLNQKALALQECGRHNQGKRAQSLLKEFTEELDLVRDFFSTYLS